MRLRPVLRWVLVALLLFAAGTFIALRDQAHESAQNRALAEQACRLIGQDRRTIYGVLIQLGYLDSVPEKTQMALRQAASRVFAHLDCSDIDLDVPAVPPLRPPP